MARINLTEDGKVHLLKRKWSDDDVIKIVKNGHSWFGGLLPPKDFQVLEVTDEYIPYVLTELKYYHQKKPHVVRRCYIFENLEKGFKSGVMDIENLIFEEGDPDMAPSAIWLDEEQHYHEIWQYCNLNLLARHHRSFINWTIEFLDVRVVYRIKRAVKYMVSGKRRYKEIFLDSIVLK